METYNTLNDAKALAKFAHFKQKDRAGFDYIEHPRRVLAAVQGQGAPPFVQMAAILHDVTEDTRFTPQMLLDLGFSPAVVNLVSCLDRKISSKVFKQENQGLDLSTEKNSKGEYFYLALSPDAEDEFYYQTIRDNPYAKIIKSADIADNTQPWRLEYLPVETQIRLYEKYTKALNIMDDRKVEVHLRFPRILSIIKPTRAVEIK